MTVGWQVADLRRIFQLERLITWCQHDRPRIKCEGKRKSTSSDPQLAKSSNPRPQGQGVTIWLGKRTRARFRAPPPIPKIPTLIGWDFFCPFPQRWRSFRAWPRERRSCEVGVFAPTDASLFSVFSGGHASVLEAISFAGAGLEAVGCGWQLL